MSNEPEIIKTNLINMKVCVPQEWDFTRIEKWAN